MEIFKLWAQNVINNFLESKSTRVDEERLFLFFFSFVRALDDSERKNSTWALSLTSEGSFDDISEEAEALKLNGRIDVYVLFSEYAVIAPLLSAIISRNDLQERESDLPCCKKQPL